MTTDTLLLVDDPETRAWLIENVLQPEHYDCQEASSLFEARAQLQQHQPQLIIVAAQLGEENGLALLREYAARYPIIVTTRQPTAEEWSQALDLGARDVLVKPFEPQRLASSIARALQITRTLQERAKLQTILREMQDVVIVTDENLHILLVNAAACQALQINETAIGKLLPQVLPLPQLLDLFEQRHVEELVWRADITLSDGRVLQGQLSRLPGVGYGAVLRDITRLMELDRIKSEFVSIVSHDLRTPLTTIRGYVSLLPRVGPLNDLQHDFVARVERSMDSIVDLISDLLDIGKIEAGVDWEMAAVPLHTVVLEAVERLRPNVEMHYQQLNVHVPELAPVSGNRRRLEQVAANLIGNAIKYTPDFGHIEVLLREDAGFLVLQISDTGIGISLEDQRRIFDKFYRVESEATEKISGTGLGLSIVKAIVKKHAGRVWVDSELGKGSTFTVLLPRYTPGKN